MTESLTAAETAATAGCTSAELVVVAGDAEGITDAVVVTWPIDGWEGVAAELDCALTTDANFVVDGAAADVLADFGFGDLVGLGVPVAFVDDWAPPELDTTTPPPAASVDDDGEDEVAASDDVLGVGVGVEAVEPGLVPAAVVSVDVADPAPDAVPGSPDGVELAEEVVESPSGVADATPGLVATAALKPSATAPAPSHL